jgi:hypothetical protein
VDLVKASQDNASASRELVDFVVDRVMPEVRAIRLGGVGLTEQLTSRTFDYFMQRVQPHAPHLGSFELVTNLSVMTEQRADLLAVSLTDVHVSIEGIEDNFTRLRGMPWSRLVKHFGMLRAAKRRNPGTRMKITLLACAMSDTLDDLLRFDVFASLGVECVILRELQPLVAHHEPHVLYRDPERTRAFVREFRRGAEAAGIETLITIAERYDPPAPPAAAPATTGTGGGLPVLRSCTLPFEVLTVVHTGQFGVCCYITDLAGPPANLSTLSVMDVWNSPKFLALRRSVNSSSPPPACLSCEVKVGHLGEEDKARVRMSVTIDEQRQQLEEQRQQIEQQRRQLAQQGAQLDEQRHDLDEQRQQMDQQRRQLEAQGQQLDQQQARLDQQDHELDGQRQRLVRQGQQLETMRDVLGIIHRTRTYRWLRRMGRWRLIERTLVEVSATSDASEGSTDSPPPATL